ncbi:MAG: arginine--tRNA ligase [Puniceicoccaceae bacterium]|nr:MAG: arginine--tRNA ligase [Puniceicoccaceae bacterium]
MDLPFDLITELERVLGRSAAAAGLPEDFSPDLRPADPRFGDIQANGVLAAAKAARANPREWAARLVEVLRADPEVAGRYEVSVAGPGFINFALTPEALLGWLRGFGSEEELSRAAGDLYRGRTWVVDFASPNTAKQMHVGHLRSIVVGESLCRILAFCGAAVIRDNHLGDWGTPYGKLFYAYRRFLDPERLKADPLEELERLYRLADEKSKQDPEVMEEARRELVRLQSGDPESLKLWEEVNRLSIEALEEIYQALDVRFDHYLGESFYRDKVEPVCEELTRLGLAEESRGALVVFHPEHPRFATQPFIIRKSDGASNYATTDLATMVYRVENLKADGIVIVTDSRQSDHFEQLWLTTRKWFEKTGRPLPEFQHVVFGTILGEDGKAIKTRTGDPIKLKALLAEAVERARQVVREKNPELPADEVEAIAAAVGLGALKYADLSQNRTSDYTFSWDKLLSFDGNTAPYLLYAVTRIRSIFRKAGVDETALDVGAATPPETEAERALARKLANLAPVVRQTVTSLRPHVLCTYLYELSGVFSSFYNADRVMVEAPEVRARRLLLCQRTLLVLEAGLHLLGLKTLRRM